MKTFNVIVKHDKKGLNDKIDITIYNGLSFSFYEDLTPLQAQAKVKELEQQGYKQGKL